MAGSCVECVFVVVVNDNDDWKMSEGSLLEIFVPQLLIWPGSYIGVQGTIQWIMAVKKYRSDICTVCKLILSLFGCLPPHVHSAFMWVSLLHSVYVCVSPNLCQYLWGLCLIRLRRQDCWCPLPSCSTIPIWLTLPSLNSDQQHHYICMYHGKPSSNTIQQYHFDYYYLLLIPSNNALHLYASSKYYSTIRVRLPLPFLME